MKLVICGSRSFNDYDLFQKTLDQFLIDHYALKSKIEVISGCARGPDEFGITYAEDHDLSIKKFPADWVKYHKSAGYRRNMDMIKYCKDSNDQVIVFAFWDGTSHGTKHMIDHCQDAGFNVKLIYPKENNL